MSRVGGDGGGGRHGGGGADANGASRVSGGRDDDSEDDGDADAFQSGQSPPRPWPPRDDEPDPKRQRLWPTPMTQAQVRKEVLARARALMIGLKIRDVGDGGLSELCVAVGPDYVRAAGAGVPGRVRFGHGGLMSTTMAVWAAWFAVEHKKWDFRVALRDNKWDDLLAGVRLRFPAIDHAEEAYLQKLIRAQWAELRLRRSGRPLPAPLRRAAAARSARRRHALRRRVAAGA